MENQSLYFQRTLFCLHYALCACVLRLKRWIFMAVQLGEAGQIQQCSWRHLETLAKKIWFQHPLHCIHFPLKAGDDCFPLLFLYKNQREHLGFNSSSSRLKWFEMLKPLTLCRLHLKFVQSAPQVISSFPPKTSVHSFVLNRATKATIF